MNGEDQGTFHLRQELHGHEQDVRAVAVGKLGIVTGSRDKTIRIWAESNNEFKTDLTLVGHTDFVSAVATAPSGSLQQLPGEAIVSGSRDLSVIIWSLAAQNGQIQNPNRIQVKGHKYQVSCVAIGRNNEIISTSHDGTIRVYSGPEFQQVTVLEGHEGAVQCVLVLESGEFLTGSNDKTIKMWKGNVCQSTFEGHTDTVRGLAALEGYGAVSASHDMSLKVWNQQAQCVGTLLGHSAIIYSVATSATGLIASASEDNTARVWYPDGQCLAKILHPGCVWDVAFLANSDLVTGCSDFVARVWTADESRQASEEAQLSYSSSIKEQKEARSAPSPGLPPGVKLEGREVLEAPGDKDGQIKIVSEASAGMAYSWNDAQFKWEKIGEVTGGGGDASMGTTELEGQEYDHVINVDVYEGQPPLKLGVNRSDNPYDVADRFIERHGLSQGYREEIANFIVQNTDIKAPIDPTLNPDPFTGGGAYIPASSSQAGNFPGFGSQSSSVTGGGADPFTGAASRRDTQMQASTSGAHIPHNTLLMFENPLKVDAVKSTIQKFSLGLANDASTSVMALTEAELAPNGTLDRLLISASGAASGQASPGVDEVALLKKLLHWPKQSLFPAFDVARLLVFNETTANRLAANAGPLTLSSTGTLGSSLASATSEPLHPGNLQTALRFLCNGFRNPALRSWILENAAGILTAFLPAFTAAQKPVRGAAASFLLNLAVQGRAQPVATDVLKQATHAASAVLYTAPPEDEDAIYRSIVALGTFASVYQGIVADIVLPVIEKLRSSASRRVSEAATEAAAVMKK